MGMRVDTGLYAEHYTDIFALIGGNGVQILKLSDVIDYHSADIVIDSHYQLITGLVVAVENYLIRREPYRQRRIKLSAGDNVYTDALLGADTAHFFAANALLA